MKQVNNCSYHLSQNSSQSTGVLKDNLIISNNQRAFVQLVTCLLFGMGDWAFECCNIGCRYSKINSPHANAQNRYMQNHFFCTTWTRWENRSMFHR